MSSANSTTGEEAGVGAVVPDVASLTAMFFLLNFLAATQDVAVDGWALTMLAPSNVGTAPLLHQNCLLTCLVCRLCGHLQLRGPDHRLGPRLRPLHHHGEQRIDVCPVGSTVSPAVCRAW